MRRVLAALERADLGYAGSPILHEVGLEVCAGQFLAVVGPNGGGKSTLLRGLLGSLRPSSGRRVAHPNLRVGFVPQHLALDADQPLSVSDVVAMGGWSRAGTRRPPLATLTELGLADRARIRFSALSGGQQQRALLARALVCDPELLLLDEPASAADAAASTALHARLKALSLGGAAVVIVTHHPRAVAELATHAVSVSGSRVRELPLHALMA